MSLSIEMIGVLQPKAEKVDKVKELFSELARQVLVHEKGCLTYNVYVQTKTTGTQNVILHERYVDQSALDHHLQAPYFLKVAGAMDTEELLSQPLNMEDVFVVPIAGHATSV